MSTPFSITSSRLAKAGLILAAALLLLAGGLFAAGASRDDEELERRYVRTLELAAQAIEAQRSAARVYERLARYSARAADASAGDLRELQAGLDELSSQLRLLGDDHGDALSPQETAWAGQAARQLQTLGADLDALRQSNDATGLRRRLAAAGDGELRQVDAALGSLLSFRRAQIDDAARQARQTGRLARISVFAAGVLALSLGVLLTLLAWRWLSANAVLMEQLTQMAREDGLTGVANRRTLDERLPQEMARARRQKYPLSVVMIDLDHFKRFNDRRGHAAGDTLLRTAAQAWMRQLRPSDLLARYGGEEFTLVLPACDQAQAQHMVERLQPLLPEKQTFSAGIATWNGSGNAQELLAAADQALLAAKRGGRNRIVVHGSEPQLALKLVS